MDYGMLLRLVPTLAAAVVVSLLVRRARREAAEARPAAPGEALSYGLPGALWKFMTGCGILLVAFVATLGVAVPALMGSDPLRQWPYKLLLALGGGLAILAGQHYRTWRLTADGEGLRLRRLLLPGLDVPWGELDALVTSNDGQTLYVMAGGRRRAGFSMVCVSHGDAVGSLYGAARSHGALVSAERDLPEGVPGPHGARRRTLDDRMGELPAWEQLLLALAFIVVFSAAFFLLVVMLMR